MEVLTLKVDNMIIERVKEFNFLGLMLDANLNWKKHIAKVVGPQNVTFPKT